MPSPNVPQAILHVIRNAGFHIGESVVVMEDGQLRSHVNAVDAETGEVCIVMAPAMYEAAVGLAQQAGFDREDG